jgi:hypothetical protein
MTALVASTAAACATTLVADFIRQFVGLDEIEGGPHRLVVWAAFKCLYCNAYQETDETRGASDNTAE